MEQEVEEKKKRRMRTEGAEKEEDVTKALLAQKSETL